MKISKNGTNKEVKDSVNREYIEVVNDLSVIFVLIIIALGIIPKINTYIKRLIVTSSKNSDVFVSKILAIMISSIIILYESMKYALLDENNNITINTGFIAFPMAIIENKKQLINMKEADKDIRNAMLL